MPSGRVSLKKPFIVGQVPLFLLLCLGIAIFGTAVYLNRAAALRQEIFNQLSGIADLKRNQIAEWRSERLAFARFLMNDPFAGGATAELLERRGNSGVRTRLLGWMADIRENYGFDNVAIVDAAGSPIISLFSGQFCRDSAFKAGLATASSSGVPVLCDLHPEDSEGIHFELIAPLGLRQQGRPRAAVVLMIDPERFLYPLLQSWPMPSRSAESVLFRTSGNRIEYLSRLRHRKNAPLSFSLPLASPRLLAVEAVRRDSGIAEALDYRKKLVLGAFREIPGSSWYLVAKIDNDEVFSPLHRLFYVILGFAVALIACAGFFVVAFDRRQKARHYRALYEAGQKFADLSARNDAILNTVPDIIAEVDVNKVYTWLNKTGHRFFGEDAVGREAAYYFEGEQDTYTKVRPLFNGSSDVFYVESWQRRCDGEKRLLAWWCQAIRDEQGAVTGALSTARDITEEREAQDRIRESEGRLRTFTDAAFEGIGVSEKGILLDANDQLLDLFGYTRDEFIGKPVQLLVAPEDRDRVGRAMREGTQSMYRHLSVRKDGTVFPVEVRARMMKIGERNIRVTAIRDISDQKRAADAIEAEKERFLVTLRSIGDGVITTDTAGTITFMNSVAEQLTGWGTDDAAGRALNEVFHIVNEQTRARCENPVDKVLSSGGIVGLANHTMLISRDGRERIVADSGAPIRDRQGTVIGVVLVFRDITEKERTEDALRNSQRLESLGTLAGGIAHDFNNLLGGVFGFIDLAMSEPNRTKAADHLAKALSAMERARALTRQLLTFSRGGAPMRQTGRLFPFIEEAARFALAGSNVSLSCEAPEDLWPCSFDRHQIGQVIGNIVLNGQQAMPGGGTISVSAENLVLDKEKAGELAAGRYVRISVRDRGVGIPKEILPHIFDPFFTTKEKGNGLGLATAFSIVRRHNGRIEVKSEPGIGSVFHVFLPASDCEADLPEPAAPVKHRGKGFVLVLEDEEVIRDALSAMLGFLGYSAVCCADGEETLRKYSFETGKGNRFAAILLDLTVPGGLGGKAAVAEIRKKDKKVPIFVASGYAGDPVLSDPHKYGFTASIAKPFLMADLEALFEKHLTAGGKGPQ